MKVVSSGLYIMFESELFPLQNNVLDSFQRTAQQRILTLKWYISAT
jgi:hypothetical protein